MRNPFEVRRERAVHDAAFEQMTEARSGIIAADSPAGRARALREFADACRACAATSRPSRLRALMPGSPILPRALTDAGVLAEAAAYSEQWLAEGRLDGTLPGAGAEFGDEAERMAWVRVFTVTGAADRCGAYSRLARVVEQRTGPAAAVVLGTVGRAYLIRSCPQAVSEGRVTVIDPGRAAS